MYHFLFEFKLSCVLKQSMKKNGMKQMKKLSGVLFVLLAGFSVWAEEAVVESLRLDPLGNPISEELLEQGDFGGEHFEKVKNVIS